MNDINTLWNQYEKQIINKCKYLAIHYRKLSMYKNLSWEELIMPAFLTLRKVAHKFNDNKSKGKDGFWSYYSKALENNLSKYMGKEYKYTLKEFSGNGSINLHYKDSNDIKIYNVMQRINQFIKKLPKHQQDLIEQRSNGKTLREIAEQRGVSFQAIHYQKENLLKKLIPTLEDIKYEVDY